MTDEEWARTWKLGVEGELIFCLALRQLNYWVTPTTEIHNQMMADGGAPRAFGPRARAIVLPDLDVMGRGQRFGFEVKSKAKPMRYHKAGIVEHGIDLPHYREYCRWQTESGTRCILGFREISSGELLVRSLDALGPPMEWCPQDTGYHGDYGRRGMAYWRRDQLFVFNQGPPADLPLFLGHADAVPPTLRTGGDDLSRY